MKQRSRTDIQEELLKHLDIDYSYHLAKRMEQYRSNQVLGYRSAGSEAEFQTGEMLKEEMERIGLFDVTKDAVTVDGWEFKKAILSYNDTNGVKHNIQLGAYQTTLVTDGPKKYSLVYLGKGTEQDYDGVDVTGKLVLADINQRDEWWINYPVYQAHLKGAAALIAVQCGGYGEIDEEALNAQDIAGPESAPAFSISRKDAQELKKLLEGRKEIEVTLDADTRVKRNCTTYNIVGRIPGRHAQRMVMLSAHYDSYFDGFQDDNTAVAMMLGIAKALLECSYQPNNTIIFCAMAAEEWGVADSDFDWSAGAYEQVFTAHPEWAGQVIADLNFELPALAHGTRARIRCCYEYVDYLEEFLEGLPNLTQAYPEETKIAAPIETWSDDFSVAISGIPSMVNDFTGGSFMETHYHSQFDNDSFYDEQVYRLHHELFALLIEALDYTVVVPLCFARVFKRAGEAIQLPDADNSQQQRKVDAVLSGLKKMCVQAEKKSRKDYEEICRLNHCYEKYLEQGNIEQAEMLFEQSRCLEASVLKQFKTEQDVFVRMDWYGNVLYPHEILSQNLALLSGAVHDLMCGHVSQCLRRLYQVDNNAYAFMFDGEVYRHFTEYVFDQPKERLKWGYGRRMKHENLYRPVKSLLVKKAQGCIDYTEEIACLRAAYENQMAYLESETKRLCKAVQQSFLKEEKGR